MLARVIRPLGVRALLQVTRTPSGCRPGKRELLAQLIPSGALIPRGFRQGSGYALGLMAYEYRSTSVTGEKVNATLTEWAAKG